jgi:hypothetical protein
MYVTRYFHDFYFFTYIRKFHSSCHHRKNERDENNWKHTSSDSVFYADSESIDRFCLNLFFESKSPQIQSKTTVVPVKLDFLNKEKE